MNTMEHYRLLASLFLYPDGNLDQVLDSLAQYIRTHYPAGISYFDHFREGIRPMDRTKREEYFVKTFEVEAICSMDVGYVLFGEDYKRGAFLAQMKREQDLAGNETGTELADHLPNILTLLTRLADKELAGELAWCIVVPSVEEILTKVENTNNLYEYAFQLLLTVLRSDFSNPELEQFQIRKEGPDPCNPSEYACGSDFLMNLGKNKFL